jgi:hypothetical protein
VIASLAADTIGNNAQPQTAKEVAVLSVSGEGKWTIKACSHDFTMRIVMRIILNCNKNKNGSYLDQTA